MTQTLNISQMKEKGFPDWMIERISNWCINCNLWDGQCNAGIICNVTIDKEKLGGFGDIEYHLSINYWMTMQMIRMKAHHK